MVNFALVLRTNHIFLGAMGLQINQQYASAELGYWIGQSFWRQGYCTEAARAVLGYGFELLELNRVYASYLTRNPASGRVMQKIGMAYEGCLRQHIKKWDVFEDLALYGILRSDWAAQEQHDVSRST